MTTTGEVLKPTREEMIAFLNGSGEIDGLMFGEPAADKRPRFWWRKYLDVLSAPQGNAAQEGYMPVPTRATDEMRMYGQSAYDHAMATMPALANRTVAIAAAYATMIAASQEQKG